MNSKRRSLNRWWWLLLLPIVVVAAPGAAKLIWELQAAADIRLHVASLRKSGQPVDYDSLTKAYFENTSQTHTSDWMELFRPVYQVNGAYFSAGLMKYEARAANDSSSSSQRITRRIPPVGDSWPEETYFVSLSNQGQPLVKRIKQITSNEDRVWLPMIIENDPPQLEALSILWALGGLFATEFEIAVYNKDMERAVQMLQLDTKARDAFDWQTTIRGEIERGTLIRDRNERLRDTLQYDLWNESQLAALAELVGPEPHVAKRWRNVFATERAITLEAIGAKHVGLVGKVRRTNTGHVKPREFVDVPASRLRDFIYDLDDGLTVADKGYEGLVVRAKQVTNHWLVRTQGIQHLYKRQDFDYWDRELASYTPVLQAWAEEFVSLENSRRFTRVSLAIKRFQLKSGEWPKTLSELDLSPRERMQVDGRPFEYMVNESPTSAVLRDGTNTTTIR